MHQDTRALSHSPKTVLLFGVFAFFLILASLTTFVGCASSNQQLYESKCSTCHSLDVVDNSIYVKGEWKSVVQDMQGMTDTISQQDAEKIIEYLENR